MPDEPSFDLERLKERLAQKVKRLQSGPPLQIGYVVDRGASDLYRIWQHPALFRAFINPRNLRAFVLSSSPATALEIRHSKIIRETPVVSGGKLTADVEAGNYGRLGTFEQWKGLLRENRLDFEEAVAEGIDAFRGEVAETQSLTTATPEGNSTEPDEMEPPTTGKRQPPRAMVEAYIREVYEQTGRKINRTEIWQKAGYKDATMFQRFQRDDPRCSGLARTNFIRLLTVDKPHLRFEN